LRDVANLNGNGNTHRLQGSVSENTSNELKVVKEFEFEILKLDSASSILLFSDMKKYLILHSRDKLKIYFEELTQIHRPIHRLLSLFNASNGSCDCAMALQKLEQSIEFVLCNYYDGSDTKKDIAKIENINECMINFQNIVGKVLKRAIKQLSGNDLQLCQDLLSQLEESSTTQSVSRAVSPVF